MSWPNIEPGTKFMLEGLDCKVQPIRVHVRVADKKELQKQGMLSKHRV